MKLIKSFIACFSTYSRIPMPMVKLDSDDMKYSMIFFPFIGAVIGLLEFLLFRMCSWINAPAFFQVCIIPVIPIIVTGGIHIDGYMDTVDAMSSYSDREKKLQIMKDPNTGAFAVIYLLVYGLIYIGFAYMLNENSIILFCISFIISRIMSGISVVTIKSAKDYGMLHDVKINNEKRTVLCILIFMFCSIHVALLFINVAFTVCSILISLVEYFVYRNKCIKGLDGITGDTSGYYLCVTELLLLLAAIVGGLVWY